MSPTFSSHRMNEWKRKWNWFNLISLQVFLSHSLTHTVGERDVEHYMTFLSFLFFSFSISVLMFHLLFFALCNNGLLRSIVRLLNCTLKQKEKSFRGVNFSHSLLKSLDNRLAVNHNFVCKTTGKWFWKWKEVKTRFEPRNNDLVALYDHAQTGFFTKLTISQWFSRLK